MKNEGITFGSHGISHTVLTKLSQEDVEYEFMVSKEIIKEKTGIIIDLFAYPNGEIGDFNKSFEQTLKKYGYNAAFTLVKGYHDRIFSPYFLGRIHINKNMGLNLFNQFSEYLFNLEI
jgi:peptidoglycan/xylan/chitin deacetylase (PgdA/CDA1 family)